MYRPCVVSSFATLARIPFLPSFTKESFCYKAAVLVVEMSTDWQSLRKIMLQASFAGFIVCHPQTLTYWTDSKVIDVTANLLLCVTA